MNETTERGWTALQTAVQLRRTDAIRMLVRLGARLEFGKVARLALWRVDDTLMQQLASEPAFTDKVAELSRVGSRDWDRLELLLEYLPAAPRLDMAARAVHFGMEYVASIHLMSALYWLLALGISLIVVFRPCA